MSPIELQGLTNFYYLKCQESYKDQDHVTRYLQKLITKKTMEHYCPKLNDAIMDTLVANSPSTSLESMQDTSNPPTPKHLDIWNG